MRYVYNHPGRFDSFIFGNSRANNISPKNFTNGKYYNLYYSLGVPSEHLTDIKLLLRRGVNIKNILLCLDFSSYSVSEEGRNADMMRLPYTDDKMKLLRTYIKYAFPIPDEKFKSQYYTFPPTPFYIRMFETGQAENTAVEKYIEENKQAHISDPKFLTPHRYWVFFMDDAISRIDSIKNICREHKINLVVVMNPIHKVTYQATNLNNYCTFLKRVSEISDFYDFSGINRVTANNYFYYETSHFRPLIGDAMTNFIQYQKRIDTIPEFGTYVTKQNIDERIAQLKNQK
jgi:hypothetical protein